MSEASHLVSIILPVRNGALYLAEALDSVRAQTYPHVELIIIDGGSTDGSLALVQAHQPDRLIVQTQPGLWAAMNLGLAASHGEYVAFISSDDRWTPDKLARQAAYLDAHPQTDMVVADVVFFVAEGQSAPPGFRSRLVNQPQPFRQLEVLLARRALFARLAPLDESHEYAADTDWFARAQDAGARLEALPGVMLYKRLHDHNHSLAAPAEHQHTLLHLLHQSLRRRAAAGGGVDERG